MKPAFTWSHSQGDSSARQASLRKVARQAAACIAELCRQRRACIQAGGHVGLWPLCLSDYFATVYTFEPEAENWWHLARNAERPSIIAARGALGAMPQMVSMQREIPKSGHWYTVPGGVIPTYTVDGLGLPNVDAIVLDVEGAELEALKGASATVARDRPLVWIEANQRAAVQAWLAPYGYGPARQGLKRDVFFVGAA